MTNSVTPKASDEIQLGDIFAPLLSYRHLIWHATVAATALAILLGGIYYFWQPVRWSASIGFRPVFSGASGNQYPNGLPFASTDIVDTTVLDQVYDKNRVQDFCSRSDFRSGFVVEETSAELQFLDSDFQARLADPRITAVDRDRLQGEYRARRQALPLQYRVTFLRAEACRTLPPVVVGKALVDVLQTWAGDADSKRGVLKLRVAVLTPAIFDFGSLDSELLIRTDLVRTALTRAIANVRDVEQLPGAELVRAGTTGSSFAEVRSRLEDLIQIRLDPLVAAAGRSLGSDAVRWVEHSFAEAGVLQKTAEDRANAYQTALREYSGVSGPLPTSGLQHPQSSSDVQSLTPQIDRTFIDRIVELSATNTIFRQELTRSMVSARVGAVQAASTVEHYRVLLESLKRTGTSSLRSADVERHLTVIVNECKEQVRQFNALYDEFSRVALRSGPSMYRIEQPTQIQSVKSFSSRSFVLFILAVLLATPFAVASGCLAHHALRQIARRLTARATS